MTPEATNQKAAYLQGYRQGAAQRFLPPGERRAKVAQDLQKARVKYHGLLSRRRRGDDTVGRRMMIYQMGVIEGCKAAQLRSW